VFRIPSFTICFFNFLVFLTFVFSILPVYGFQKNWRIFVSFYCMDPRFYEQIEIFEIPNFNKIPSFTICFFNFLVFLTSFFSYFTCLWFSKELENFCVVLLYGSEILSKNWDIWNPKVQQNSIVYYFFFNFLAFLAFRFVFHVP